MFKVFFGAPAGLAPFPFTDDFNRASLGSTWVTIAGTWVITSNELQSTTAADADAALIAAHELVADVKVTVPLRSSTVGVVGLYARMVGTTYIFALFDSGNWVIYDVVAGTPSAIASGSGLSFAQGDVLGLEVVGTTAKLLKNGSQVGSSGTTGVSQSGFTGIFSSTTNQLFDDYSAGYPATEIALTGVGGTSSVGSLALTAALALTGLAGTSAVGSLARGETPIALAGVSAPGAVGLLSPGFTLTPSGVSITGTVGTLGRAYTAPAAGDLGIFDPKYCDDPSVAGRVHRLVSYVDIDDIGNPIPPNTYGGWWMVSQALSTSNDYGATWGSATPINYAVDHDGDFLVQNEVGGIVYDAGEADADEKWKMVWMRTVFDKTLSPAWLDPTKCSIMMRTAPAIGGPWSDPITLLAGSEYDPDNEHNGGASQFTDNGALLVAEPGIVAHPTSGFYLAYTGNTGVDSTGYIKLCRIHKVASVLTKTDIGNPMSWANDVAYFQALGTSLPGTFPNWDETTRFDAADLVAAKNGGHWLLVTPVSATGVYRGMAAIRFTDIDAATLNRESGNPVIEFFVAAGAYHHGAATHSIYGQASGVAVSLLDGTFQIVQLGANLPVYAALTGNVGAGGIGALSPTLAAALTGPTAPAGVAGSLGLACELPLVGNAGVLGVGSFGPAFALPLTGNLTTGDVGVLTPELVTLIELSGVEATAMVGALAPSLSPALAGLGAQSAVGSLASGEDVDITGVQIEGAVGFVGLAFAPPLSGIGAAGAVGAPSATLTIPVTGSSATGDVGILTPDLTAQAQLSGVEATATVGALASSSLLTLLGNESATGVGSLGAVYSVEAALSGVEALTGIGSLAPTATADLTGPGVTGSVGNLTAHFEREVALSGVVATASVGGFGAEIAIDMLGNALDALLGDMQVSSGTVLQPVTGVAAVGAVGSLLPVFYIEAPGVAGAGFIGSPIVGTQLELTGAPAATALGSLRWMLDDSWNRTYSVYVEARSLELYAQLRRYGVIAQERAMTITAQGRDYAVDEQGRVRAIDPEDRAKDFP